MLHRTFAVLVLAASTALPMRAQHAPPDADATAIKAIITRMDEDWNRHDMKAWTADMTDDVEWINIVGMQWKGKADVFKAHDIYHHTIFKDRKLYPAQNLELRQVAPNVVVASFVTPADGFTMTNGTVVPPNRNVLSEVFVKQGGRWWIAEGHNTAIDEAAIKRNPVGH